MTEAWVQYGLTALIAGVFGVGTALLTARLSAAAERARSAREMKSNMDAWKREFAEHYAEVIVSNRPHANGSNLTFESLLGFPRVAACASLRDARRKIHHRFVGRSASA